ncbi:MAG: hypothetical protein ACFE95_09205 [Candidatus Hodarchaeota archaeon]
MVVSKSKEPDLRFHDKEIIIVKSKNRGSFILSFLLVLAGLTLTFVVIRLYFAQFFGQQYIAIDLPSLIVSILGATILTYLYHTRYVRRVLVLRPHNFSITIGKQLYEYSWSDFSIVVLGTSSASYGAKGFIIRLYEDKLDSEYIDIPLYRYPIKNAFEYRRLVEERVKSAKQTSQNKS